MMAFRMMDDGCSGWDVSKLFQSGNQDEYIAMVLNHGLDNLTENQLEVFIECWNKANLRISVDGGTNILHNIWNKIELPNIISGDFDSIRKESLDFFEQKNVPIIPTPDQDETDFTKALKQIPAKDEQNSRYVVVFWQRTPRLDQTFSVIHTLHIWNINHSGLPVFLVDLTGSISWLLSKGSHLIETSVDSEWCSIVPFNRECKVTSTGLKYNMNQLALSFDSIISTSNSFDPSAKRVKLRLDESALWSQELHLASSCRTDLVNEIPFLEAKCPEK